MKDWLLQILSEQEKKEYENLIYCKKSQNKIFVNANLTPAEEKLLLRILEIYLLTIIENFNMGYHYPLNSEFVNLNQVCFDIYQVLPMPQNNYAKMERIFNLVIFAYLSNNTTQIQQFLSQNKDLWNITNDTKVWEKKLFIDLTKAVAYMVIEQYDKSLEIIDLILEKTYTGKRCTEYNVLLGLLGFVMVLKSVKMVCEYMQRKTSDEHILTNLEVQINKGLELIECAGEIKLYVLINFLS